MRRRKLYVCDVIYSKFSIEVSNDVSLRSFMKRFFLELLVRFWYSKNMSGNLTEQHCKKMTGLFFKKET